MNHLVVARRPPNALDYRSVGSGKGGDNVELLEQLKTALGDSNIAYTVDGDTNLPVECKFDFAQDCVWVNGDLADDAEGIEDFLSGDTTFYMNRGLYRTPEDALKRENPILLISGEA